MQDLENKELARDLTHDKQQLLSQQHVMVLCAVNFNTQLYSPSKAATIKNKQNKEKVAK